jgi:hypothetical protein
MQINIIGNEMPLMLVGYGNIGFMVNVKVESDYCHVMMAVVAFCTSCILVVVLFLCFVL